MRVYVCLCVLCTYMFMLLCCFQLSSHRIPQGRGRPSAAVREALAAAATQQQNKVHVYMYVYMYVSTTSHSLYNQYICTCRLQHVQCRYKRKKNEGNKQRGFYFCPLNSLASVLPAPWRRGSSVSHRPTFWSPSSGDPPLPVVPHHLPTSHPPHSTRWD